MTAPRLFLVAPPALAIEDVLACATTAAASGDCASIIIPSKLSLEQTAALQSAGLAVMLKDCDARDLHYTKADGIHLSSSEQAKTLRTSLKSESIGVFAATSRHLAMEAAEAGADYVAFAQKSQAHGEPLLLWWHDIAQIPAVAFDPVDPEEIATLLPQKPDFIRPSDTMWQSAEAARTVVSKLMAHLQ
jgi:thiamine-phosphate pyrophosphorylase